MQQDVKALDHCCLLFLLHGLLNKVADIYLHMRGTPSVTADSPRPPGLTLMVKPHLFLVFIHLQGSQPSYALFSCSQNRRSYLMLISYF